MKRVAARTGEALPEEIYLIEDVDGGIAYRGGFLGIGSRRVMFIGLPLLYMLTVPQFEALVTCWFVYFGATNAVMDECLLEVKGGLFRVLHSRILPDRWLKFNVFLFPFVMSASMNCDAEVPGVVRDALQDAMEIAISSVPMIDGTVFVCPDRITSPGSIRDAESALP